MFIAISQYFLRTDRYIIGQDFLWPWNSGDKRCRWQPSVDFSRWKYNTILLWNQILMVELFVWRQTVMDCDYAGRAWFFAPSINTLQTRKSIPKMFYYKLLTRDILIQDGCCGDVSNDACLLWSLVDISRANYVRQVSWSNQHITFDTWSFMVTAYICQQMWLWSRVAEFLSQCVTYKQWICTHGAWCGRFLAKGQVTFKWKSYLYLSNTIFHLIPIIITLWHPDIRWLDSDLAQIRQ